LKFNFQKWQIEIFEGKKQCLPMVSLRFFAKVKILTIYGKVTNKFSNGIDHLFGK